jgi:hypothetical protein
MPKALDAEEQVTHSVPESDWKTFRELRELALQRFSKGVLEEVLALIQHGPGNDHERYLAVFRLVRERDKQLADVFDNLARSRMIMQLTAMRALGLISSQEFERFTQQTRDIMDLLAVEPAR